MGGSVKRTHVVSRRIAGLLALLTAALGVAGLAGWIFDSPLLRTVISGYASMKANTALGLTLAGLALFHYCALGRPGFGHLFFRRYSVVIVAALGASALVEYVAGVDLGIDQLLFADPFTPVEMEPGRMSRAGAVGFLLYAFATLFTPRKPQWSFWTGFALTATGFWIALFVCIGFMFDAQSIYSSRWFGSVALHTALGFLALFTALMLAVPDRGWARIVMTDKFGGVVARRLLPIIAVVPLSVMWFAHLGEEFGLYPDRVGEYIAAVGVLIVLTTVVLVMCGRLNVIDAHRRVVAEGRQRAIAAAARMRRIADMDALTELWNRRYFLEEAAAQIKTAQAEGTPLALLMIDIDHFKRINDTHGHLGGDKALRLLGATLKDFTRRDDCAARLGGEEFAVLLPGAAAAVAQNIGERICEQLARLIVLDGEGRRFSFTVSIGIALLAEGDGKPEDLLARADAALYEAKRAGRNRVELAPEAQRTAA
jgi:diguanylate cyclase (GGDEF)-like protein